MGVFDDLKPGSNDKSTGSDLDSGLDGSLDDSGLDSSLDDPAPRNQNQGHNSPSGQNSVNNSSQQGRNGQHRSNNPRKSSQGSQHPNAQAGRPDPGSSSPQLSSQTRRKMENAGLNNQGQQNQARNRQDQPQQHGRQGQRGQNELQPGKDSVAQQRGDLEELKSQNEQIIELLKRINQNLQGRR